MSEGCRRNYQAQRAQERATPTLRTARQKQDVVSFARALMQSLLRSSVIEYVSMPSGAAEISPLER